MLVGCKISSGMGFLSLSMGISNGVMLYSMSTKSKPKVCCCNF